MSLKTPTQMDYSAPYVLGQIREFIFNDSLVDLETLLVKEFDNIAKDEYAARIVLNNESMVDILLTNDILLEKLFTSSEFVSFALKENLFMDKCLNDPVLLSKFLSYTESSTQAYDNVDISEKILSKIFDLPTPYVSTDNNTKYTQIEVSYGSKPEYILRYSDPTTVRAYSGSSAGSVSPGRSLNASLTCKIDLTNANVLSWSSGYYSSEFQRFTLSINDEQLVRTTTPQDAKDDASMIRSSIDVSDYTGMSTITFQVTSKNTHETASRIINIYLAVNKLRLEV